MRITVIDHVTNETLMSDEWDDVHGCTREQMEKSRQFDRKEIVKVEITFKEGTVMQDAENLFSPKYVSSAIFVIKN